MVERPASAFRRPASARPRPAAVAAVEEPPPSSSIDLEDYWMFKSETPLSVSDVAAAGFANCAILDANRWYSGTADVSQNVVVKDLSYTFGVDIDTDAIINETSTKLIEALRIAFCSHGSDVLIVFQNVNSSEPNPVTEVVARIIDLINRAYEAAESNEDYKLAGVSVVLENYKDDNIVGKWDNGEDIKYPTHLFSLLSSQ